MERLKTFYREKRYICGEYLDVYVYPVFKEPIPHGKRMNPTSTVQAALNARHAAEKLTRLLHTNFTSDDLTIGLDYAVNPDNDEQAKRDIQNFIRRIRRLRKKLGLLPLKYISTTEKSGTGRFHHHVVMNGGVDRDMVESLWGHGRANSKRLQFNEQGVSGLSRYIVKNPVFDKRWNSSRNLTKPEEPKPRDHLIRSRKKAEELARGDRYEWEKLHPDYHLSGIMPFYNTENGGVYILARLYKKNGWYISPSHGRKHHQRKKE
jgi:hypothetical protein